MSQSSPASPGASSTPKEPVTPSGSRTPSRKRKEPETPTPLTPSSARKAADHKKVMDNSRQSLRDCFKVTLVPTEAGGVTFKKPEHSETPAATVLEPVIVFQQAAYDKLGAKARASVNAFVLTLTLNELLKKLGQPLFDTYGMKIPDEAMPDILRNVLKNDQLYGLIIAHEETLKAFIRLTRKVHRSFQCGVRRRLIIIGKDLITNAYINEVAGIWQQIQEELTGPSQGMEFIERILALTPYEQDITAITRGWYYAQLNTSTSPLMEIYAAEVTRCVNTPRHELILASEIAKREARAKRAQAKEADSEDDMDDGEEDRNNDDDEAEKGKGPATVPS